jgi:hypothetical protein
VGYALNVPAMWRQGAAAKLGWRRWSYRLSESLPYRKIVIIILDKSLHAQYWCEAIQMNAAGRHQMLLEICRLFSTYILNLRLWESIWI